MSAIQNQNYASTSLGRGGTAYVVLSVMRALFGLFVSSSALETSVRDQILRLSSTLYNCSTSALFKQSAPRLTKYLHSSRSLATTH